VSSPLHLTENSALSLIESDLRLVIILTARTHVSEVNTPNQQWALSWYNLYPQVFADLMTVDAIDSSFRCFMCSCCGFDFRDFVNVFETDGSHYSVAGLCVPCQYRLPSSRGRCRWGFGYKMETTVGFDSDEVGVGTPGSMCAVLALNSLQSPWTCTLAPSAWASGGVGARFPLQ